MLLISKFRQTIAQVKRRLDPASIQFRLTTEIAVLFILGLGSVAIWTSWKMQQILIATHKQNVEYIAARFPHDLEIYSEMLPVQAGVQKTIDNVAVSGLLIWVKGADGKLLAQSASLNPSTATTQLMSLSEMPPQPQVYQVGTRYLILCESPLTAKGTMLGKVYIAQDVTEDLRQLITAISSLAVVCVLATIVIMALVALRIRRSLQPLQDLSKMAGVISVKDLGEAKLQLHHAPSEVKELAQTFNMMLSRLFNSWEQQRQFVSNVSHELRTPLTVVLGYLQSVLRRSTNLNDYQQEALETAASEADRTVQLLQNLLDLARADSGYIHLNLELLLLNDLVAEVAGMTEKFSNRCVIVEAEREVEAMADRDRLKQVLINLVDNAVKYSPADEPIILKLQARRQAIIQVCDRGVGIPLQDQSRIFERFYRVDESRARISGGHGLGLAIVKTLVEAMSGTIIVQSKPDQGSTFTITLPR